MITTTTTAFDQALGTMLAIAVTGTVGAWASFGGALWDRAFPKQQLGRMTTLFLIAIVFTVATVVFYNYAKTELEN